MIEEFLGPIPSKIALQSPKYNCYLKASCEAAEYFEFSITSSYQGTWEDRGDYFGRKLTVANKPLSNKMNVLFQTEEVFGLFKDLILKMISLSVCNATFNALIVQLTWLVLTLSKSFFLTTL
jgi:hypothetical protein